MWKWFCWIYNTRRVELKLSNFVSIYKDFKTFVTIHRSSLFSGADFKESDLMLAFNGF